MKNKLSKKKLNYTEGKGFIKTLKISGENHGARGIFQLTLYLLKRLSNLSLHQIAQIAPYNKFRTMLHKTRGVNIGNRVQVGIDVWIDEAFPEYVFIEDNVAISIGCKILSHSIPPEYHRKKLISYAAPVYIKKNVWIGVACIILPGVTIGEGSVISAGSVVSTNIPPHSIVRGNPAQVVGVIKK